MKGARIASTGSHLPRKVIHNEAFDQFPGAAREICNSPGVHAAGYCIGGTALAALMAWLNRRPGGASDGRVADWTLFSTLTDFSEPGELGAFMGEEAFDFLDSLMAADGPDA